MKYLVRYLMKLSLVGAVAAALNFPTTSAVSADTLLIQAPPPNFSTVRPFAGMLGVLARVDVGNSNVSVNRIGMYGRVYMAQNVKWLIFGNVGNSAPIMQTAPVSLSAGSTQWLDSPIFSPFTLQANTTYWIGIAANGPNSSLRLYGHKHGILTISNGLILPTDANGLPLGSFASPTLASYFGSIQASVRLFGPTDTDGDGVADTLDNCPADPNPLQEDNDSDGAGDICDADDDNDGVEDIADNCPTDPNSLQEDFDLDGLGNACDAVFDGNAIVMEIEALVLDLRDIIVSVDPPGGNGMITKLTGKGGVLRKVGNALTAFEDGLIGIDTYLSELQVALDMVTSFDNQLAAKTSNGQIPEVTEGQDLRVLSAEVRSIIESLITVIGG